MSLAIKYYLRDSRMKLDPQTQIVKSLEKLGYTNVDYDKKFKDYLNYKLSHMILTGKMEYDKELNFYLEELKSSDNFISFCKHIDYQKKRSVELNHFLTNEITKAQLKEFYEKCTEEELNYLGF